MIKFPRLTDLSCFSDAKNPQLSLLLELLDTFLGPGVSLPARDQDRKTVKSFRQNQPFPLLLELTFSQGKGKPS